MLSLKQCIEGTWKAAQKNEDDETDARFQAFLEESSLFKLGKPAENLSLQVAQTAKGPSATEADVLEAECEAMRDRW